MSNYDWGRFVVRIPINASQERLYDAWCTRKGIEHWFLRMSEYRSPDGELRKDDEPVEAGDTYAWRWHGWPDEVEERGINQGDRVVLDVRHVKVSAAIDYVI